MFIFNVDPRAKKIIREKEVTLGKEKNTPKNENINVYESTKYTKSKLITLQGKIGKLKSVINRAHIS